MIVDTHIHTCFSSDSTMQLSQALERAGQLGIGITLTEHMDLCYPEQQSFTFDLDEYWRQYQPYRSQQLLLGIEIGMRPECIADNRHIVRNNPFDYVIGSIHVVDDIDIYHEEFYQNRSKQQVYQQYFAAMADCLTSHDFIDSLGHIDYIARYARYSDKEIHYHEFTSAIDEVLQVLAKQEKALEINTRRLGDPAVVTALLPIYRRFYELGGRLATFGSDAHRPTEIGRDFKQAAELAAAANLQLVYFKDRKPYNLK